MTEAPVRERAAAIVVFAAAMGWLEAVVVVYIRGILGIARTETIPPAEEVFRRLHSVPWLLTTEQTREAATIVMLGAVAAIAARRFSRRFGVSRVLRGLGHHVLRRALRARCAGRPASAPGTLFLIPAHQWWYQPVWLPVLISCGFIAYGCYLRGY